MRDDQLSRNRSIVMLTSDRQVDRRILLQAESLEAAGWAVTILAMPPDKPMPAAFDERWVTRIGQDGLVASRENLVLNCYRWLRGRVPMNGSLMRWLKRFAWRYLVDQESFYSRLFYGTASRYRPGVFVAHDLPMLPVARQVAEVCGARLVYDSHELFSEQEFSRREKRKWGEIENKLIGICDAVITVNESIARELEQRYRLKRVEVIYNAERARKNPEISRRFHEAFGLSEDKKILLLQGGLTAGRNLEMLVEAMLYVKNPSVVLVMLGDGILQCRLQKQAQAANLTGRVYFHPAVSQKKLLALTAAADAGVIPYRATCLNNYYCTPNKLFEFIAAGLPILASDLPELGKIINGRNIGMVGDFCSPESLAKLIDGFFSDESRLASWRENVAVAAQSICWEEEEKKLVRIYEALP